MDFASNYDIDRTAEFILARQFSRVALQFPDELLRDSTRVVRALREKLRVLSGGCSEGEIRKKVGLYVMADTLYGSCCVDEVGASHIAAECVIHYGHSCLSPASTLPVLLVFGKAPVNVSACAGNISDLASNKDKPILVLFGLEYTHAMRSIREATAVQASQVVLFADVICSSMDPSKDCSFSNLQVKGNGSQKCGSGVGTRFNIGGLTWELPEGKKVEDYLLFWVGPENSAFTNVVLTFNGCEIVRYDAAGDCLAIDLIQKERILMRRYFMVEKAKDANIVGILVGTLGVAGYLHMIHQIKRSITAAGKKAYIFAMGRPNPAKLANFPECDVFVYISCAETALWDSKEFLAPIISPFEAMVAYSRGMQWTGEYTLQFRDLISKPLTEDEGHLDEARFSFFQGGYVEDIDRKENVNCSETILEVEAALEKDLQIQEKHPRALVNRTVKSGAEYLAKDLQIQEKHPQALVNRTVKSGAEYLAKRSYKGLDVQDNASPAPFLVGRSGRAAGYDDEKCQQ